MHHELHRSASASLALLLLLLGGCGTDRTADAAAPTTTSPSAPPSTSPTSSTTVAPSTTTTSTTVPPTTSTTAQAWIVGADPLPLRPDGLGEILPTPEVLVDRALPTNSALAPPPDERFRSSVEPIDATIRERMGETWSPECPVALDELRYLTLSFWGFDGKPHTGEMVVNVAVADDVVEVFERLHAARFPIEEMRLVTTADLRAEPTGDGNNTASFVCRAVRGGSSWSEHARGLAIDINPFHNPYRRGDIVLPELASAYLDRSWSRPGMVQPGGVVTEAFESIGWRWGGTWSSPDYMHFSLAGR